MGKSMAKEPNDYQLAKKLVSEMNVGDIQSVKPKSVVSFRAYLTTEGQKAQKHFTTKSKGGELMVARIKKENIFDKIK
jgi:hypothetical protein